MLTEEIKQSKTYQTLLALSTGLIHPNKIRGKGSKGKKQAVIPKKKGSISVEDNIIPKPDVSIELGKYMSLTEAKEEEAARRVHATHECLVMESDEPSDEPTNRPTSKRRPSDSSEGAGITPEVPDELTRKFITSSEGASIVPEGSEDDSHQSDDEYVDEEDDDRSIDIAENDDETTESENDDQEMTDAEKIVGEKLEEEKGDEEEEQADDDQAQKDQAEDDIVGTLITMS
ncbi:hypothetical protein Tco_0820631 [Tanacetum coccineum]|uniref:Uncharacterized protein n=1 Tax=Tanacetum coccineum TaxID=301880 RepID=A0ABQ5ACK9_9ASTR